MNDNGLVFNQNAKNIAFDDEHYEKMMSRYDNFKHIIENKVVYYSDLDLEKKRASNIRTKAFKKLDRILVDFDTNFTDKGGKLLWANDDNDAKQMIFNILSQEKVKSVLRTKSSTLEEIGLTSFLKSKKINVVDTDIGDFVCNLYDERPYNIQVPAAHKNVVDIASLYSERFGIKENCNAKQLTICTKNVLKDSMLNSEVVITGANFLVSNTGSVVFTENEGNIIKSMSFPPIHIIVAGIDKLINSIEDLGVLLPISSLYEPNKNVSTYYHILNNAGGKKVFLILLNNGRTDVLSKEKQRNILSCIQCGACAEVCPIYNIIGGHTYDENIPGPVGSILAPIVKGMEESAHLCSLCASCGRCNEVCPVNITLRDLFIENKNDLVKTDKALIGERYFLSYLMKKFSSRKSLDKYGSGFKNFELKQYIKKKWGNKRELPKFAEESFSEYWRNNNQ